MAFWMRIHSILKCGNIIDDIAQRLYDGYGGVAPLEGGGHAFLTMGTPEMVKEGQITRFICPGMSNRHYGDRYDNEHAIVFDPDLLFSPTHSIAFHTRAHGQQNKKFDDTYGARTIVIGGDDRIFRRLHENQACDKPCDKYKYRSALVKYQVVSKSEKGLLVPNLTRGDMWIKLSQLVYRRSTGECYPFSLEDLELDPVTLKYKLKKDEELYVAGE
jgi:hypothetical protein